MSGLFDKRTSGGSERREVRTRQEQQEKRKTRIIATAVISALLILVIGAVIINSGFLRRSAAAFTIGDMPISATKFDYFYNMAVFDHEESDAMHRPGQHGFLGNQIFDRET